MDGRLLVATDGTAWALGALRVASALVERGMAPPLVLAVQELVPLYDEAAPAEMIEAKLTLERLGAERLGQAVREQLAGMGGGAARWEVRVEVGAPPAAIAAAARSLGAPLILLGQGRHAPADRWLGSETALRVMQLAHVPVLATHAAADGLPRTALVAEDFSDHSRAAGALALDLLAPPAALHLAHVAGLPPASQAAFARYNWVDHYLARARERLRARREELLPRAAGPVEVHVLPGSPVPELVQLAGTLGADLIAAGRHGGGFMGRFLIGGVSTGLVRCAKCSVLIVPAPARRGG